MFAHLRSIYGLVQPILLLQNDAQIVIGVRKIRIEFERGTVVRRRIFKLALLLKNGAKVEMGVRRIRL